MKNSHPVVSKYDIGAHAEPNGHGTLSYNMDAIQAALKGNNSVEAKKLIAFLKMSNDIVGDAISNMLLIESILYDLDMTVQDFIAIYDENPSKTFKIKVQDKDIFKTIPDESRLIEPMEIQ